MKKTKTYNVQIWIGLRDRYSAMRFSLEDVRKIVDGFISENNDCITITPTEYRYVNGSEEGAVIGWINYPRFPRRKEEIIKRAINLGKLLMTSLNQYRVSVVTPEETLLLENKNL